MTMRVIFLHIPKTAGQSVHYYLVNLFGKDVMCPARVNDQLIFLPLDEIRKYRVFSGHIDWSLVDCVPAPRFVFTVLRDPFDRILSFYFYLHEKAKTLSAAELDQPWNMGMRRALQLSPDEYFSSKDPGFRTFINNHYDNFYTYYFAGRSFDARQKIVGNQQRANLGDDDIVNLALRNLATLDGVYGLRQLDALDARLQTIAGSQLAVPLREVKVNEGPKLPISRIKALRELGATQATFDQLERMTRLDRKIWIRYDAP